MVLFALLFVLINFNRLKYRLSMKIYWILYWDNCHKKYEMNEKLLFVDSEYQQIGIDLPHPNDLVLSSSLIQRVS